MFVEQVMTACNYHGGWYVKRIYPFDVYHLLSTTKKVNPPMWFNIGQINISKGSQRNGSNIRLLKLDMFDMDIEPLDAKFTYKWIKNKLSHTTFGNDQ